MTRILISALAMLVARNVVSAGSVDLAPGVAVFIPTPLPGPAQTAVADLQRDLARVLGKPSRVVTESEKLGGRPAIVIVAPGEKVGAWAHPKIQGAEAHGIYTRFVGGAPRIVIHGADVRGLIYAIYSFSEEFLGVPPLWYWTDWKPLRRQSLSLPSDLERIFPPAYVRWRAWFNNDQDFLMPWRRNRRANTDAMFETILRLKYNTYEVDSVVNSSQKAPRFTASPDAIAAHERGLAITFHHHAPLGSRIGRNLEHWAAFWAREGRGNSVPELSVQNAPALFEFWRYHVETAVRAGFECVWSVSFRGGGDIPFWMTFKDAPVDMAARGRVIEQMMKRQIAIIKEVSGDPAPVMRTTLYNENSDLFAAGHLRPPAEPTLIWNFVAARRDHFPAADVRSFNAPADLPIGYYLNFQFTSTGSHLAAAEGPWKMAANYRVLDGLNSRPLTFVVVNAGNIREHLTELSANGEMMWRFHEFDADSFLRRYCAQYFGTGHAHKLASLYRDYYNAYWNQKPADIPGFERQYIFHDMRYARAVEMMLGDMNKGVRRNTPLAGHPLDNPDHGSPGYFRVEPLPGVDGEVEAILQGTAASGRKFASVAAEADRLLPRVDANGRTFFNDNLRVPAHLMAHLNRMLHEMALAYRASDDRPRALRHLRAAHGALAAAQAALAETHHGVFANWHDGDEKFRLIRLKDSIAELAARLEHGTHYLNPRARDFGHDPDRIGVVGYSMALIRPHD